ncbi:sec-independent protein translocase protein [Candidatus Photodesmus blepharus]|uniref:Sec-independent protein translocase protein TatC n=1 Tax=Candidatus Photodesmus blepharonis TaxID=1179155 RepID=A0A084CNS2_9GAMM|nr:twin-arginine translocase subunit TatC [Candidatus Photodesmus blepharus]KEY91451.1 sec-independent protein translocase protein [Candidatus Photodesmus blepharus]
MPSTTPAQSLLGHLLEIRNRLLKSTFFVIVVFLGLSYFSNDIYELISAPLVERLPEGTTMIATEITSPFIIPLKLTFTVSLFLSMAFILYQIWAFIAPSLYKYERHLIIPLMFSSLLLFYCGVAFAYFLIFPLTFNFFAGISLEGVKFTTDISSYLDFVLALFFVFGIAFEIPVIIALLCWTGSINPKNLRKRRPYVIVIAFIIGMVLTPPDIVSQTLLAIPICLLFEVGLLLSHLYYVRKR